MKSLYTIMLEQQMRRENLISACKLRILDKDILPLYHDKVEEIAKNEVLETVQCVNALKLGRK